MLFLIGFAHLFLSVISYLAQRLLLQAISFQLGVLVILLPFFSFQQVFFFLHSQADSCPGGCWLNILLKFIIDLISLIPF